MNLLYKVALQLTPSYITLLQPKIAITTYGTAQFKLQARKWTAHVHFVVRYVCFSKSCVSVGQCTEIFRPIYHACHQRACLFLHARKEISIVTSNSINCVRVRDHSGDMRCFAIRTVAKRKIEFVTN